MTLKPYLIGQFTSGQQRDVQQYLLPEDAFDTLEDAYCWRSRIRKRFGYRFIGSNDLNSRLRLNIGQTDPSGDISGIAPGTSWKVGQEFSIGSQLFTVNASGPSTMLDTGAATVKTFDTGTGAFDIQGATPLTNVYFYPANPVMGLLIRETGVVNDENTIAFDTQFAYTRIGVGWQQIDNTVWNGADNDFFWGMNARGANAYDTNFYVVNYNSADNIKYLPSTASTWTTIRPFLNTPPAAERRLDTSRIIVRYKDRHICLNTKETDASGPQIFPMRARFSQQGDPTNEASSWVDDKAGRGGFIDAPTKEQIITADIIKDRLIVYFERSTWELVYTGFPSVPFKWQQINNELGCESTFSVIGFDNGIVGVGNVGIHSCDGTNVVRIDEKIPDEIFAIQNDNSGTDRVYGIRNYAMELVYWTFPSTLEDYTFPTRILVYNYKNGTWAFFNDSFTCFGNFQKDDNLTWSTVGEVYPTWSSWNSPWRRGRSQSSYPDIIAGNQQGFVVVIDSERSSNAPSLYITDIVSATSTFTIINHNLFVGDYVKITDVQGVTGVNDTIFVVTEVLDANTVVLDASPSGTYTGGGVAARVSNINIITKQYNPGTPVGRQFIMSYIDFLVDVTDSGEVTLEYFTDSNRMAVSAAAPTGVFLGSSVLPSYRESTLGEPGSSEYEWHRFYLQSEGKFVQLQFSLSDQQMRTSEISESDFVLNAMILYVQPSGRIVG